MKVTLIRSPIALKKKQKLTLKALGLNKLNKSIEVDAKNHAHMGMIKLVEAFVKIEEGQS